MVKKIKWIDFFAISVAIISICSTVIYITFFFYSIEKRVSILEDDGREFDSNFGRLEQRVDEVYSTISIPKNVYMKIKKGTNG